MSADRLIAWALRGCFLLALVFIFVPIVISFIFSFSPERYPTLPLSGFSTACPVESLGPDASGA